MALQQIVKLTGYQVESETSRATGNLSIKTLIIYFFIYPHISAKALIQPRSAEAVGET